MCVLQCSWCSYQEQKGLVFWFKVFDVFHKVLVCYWLVMNICVLLFFNSYTLPISYNLCQSTFSTIPINFSTHTFYFFNTLFKFWIFTKTYTSFLPSKPATLISRVLLELLCNYIKFWYFCVFALWPESLRFLRKGPKSLKDKLFCSFNEVFVIVEIFGF